MSNLSTQTERLRFFYTYRQAALVGAYDGNHVKLAQHCLDHLYSLNSQGDGADYPWDCYPHAVQAQSELIEVSVDFVFKHGQNQSSTPPLHAKQLWHALVTEYDREASWTLFGGRMYSINMRPVDVESAGARTAMTFGRLAESTSIDMECTTDMEDVAKLTAENRIALAADTFLRMLEGGSKAIASCVPVLASESALLKGLPPLLNTVASPTDAISTQSLATGCPKIAQAASRARLQIQRFLHEGTTEEALAKIAETTAALWVMFQNSHRATVARIRYCAEMDICSADMYDEAMQNVAQLRILARHLAVGSKELTAILENQRTVRNTGMGTVWGTAAIAGVGALFFPPTLAAVGVAYLGVGVAAGTGSYLAVKRVEESTQGEKLIQSRAHLEKVHQKLFFHTATCFVTEVWGFHLQTMPPADKEKFFNNFGIDLDYLCSRDYTKAHLKAALEEVEKSHDCLMYDVEGVFLDLGITARGSGNPVACQAAQAPIVQPSQNPTVIIEELEETRVSS